MKLNSTRQLVAQLAAQLMYEHSIHDYAQARRKAAKQLCIVDAHHLPDNSEIEAAIRERQTVFFADDHADTTQRLRLLALDVMRELDQFDPHLTGDVLQGTAGQYANISIELYADSEKEVEMHLLNHNIPFQQSQTTATRHNKATPRFVLQHDNNDIWLTIRPRNSRHNTPRPNDTTTLRRASLLQLTELLGTAD
jgi:hypothetical protein